MKEDRIKKIESKVLEISNNVIFNIKDDLEIDFGIITITKVKLSKDTSYIDLYVSAIKNKDLLTKELAKNAYLVKKDLSKGLSIRKIPIVRFRYDDEGEKVINLVEKIDSLI